jgi:hypothetical protein
MSILGDPFGQDASPARRARRTKCRGTIRALRCECKATRLATSYLHLAHRHIQMPTSVTWDGANVGTVNHHHFFLSR